MKLTKTKPDMLSNEQDKIKFLDALKKNNDVLDEYEIAENLDITPERFNQILFELESQGVVEYTSFGLCSYRVVENR